MANRIAIAYLKGEIEEILNNRKNSMDENFVGLAFGRRGSFYYPTIPIDIAHLGLGFPFVPSVFCIYKSRNPIHYRNGQIEMDVMRYRLVEENLYPDSHYDFNGVPRPSRINPENLASTFYHLEFDDHISFDTFGFALFTTFQLESILAFSENLIYLSGALIDFGKGNDTFGSRSSSGWDSKLFTFKIETDNSENNMLFALSSEHSSEVFDTSIGSTPLTNTSGTKLPGEPEFVLGVPCPPQWRSH